MCETNWMRFDFAYITHIQIQYHPSSNARRQWDGAQRKHLTNNINWYSCTAHVNVRNASHTHTNTHRFTLRGARLLFVHLWAEVPLARATNRNESGQDRFDVRVLRNVEWLLQNYLCINWIGVKVYDNNRVVNFVHILFGSIQFRRMRPCEISWNLKDYRLQRTVRGNGEKCLVTDENAFWPVIHWNESHSLRRVGVKCLNNRRKWKNNNINGNIQIKTSSKVCFFKKEGPMKHGFFLSRSPIQYNVPYDGWQGIKRVLCARLHYLK